MYDEPKFMYVLIVCVLKFYIHKTYKVNVQWCHACMGEPHIRHEFVGFPRGRLAVDRAAQVFVYAVVLCWAAHPLSRRRALYLHFAGEPHIRHEFAGYSRAGAYMPRERYSGRVAHFCCTVCGRAARPVSHSLQTSTCILIREQRPRALYTCLVKNVQKHNKNK